MNDYPQYHTYNCSCEHCLAMCHRPCWGTPKQIQKIIDAGFGNKLMIDYYYKDDSMSEESTVPILSPALKGLEGDYVSWMPMSSEGCTFWHNNLCQLHDKGLKPLEGQTAYHEKDPVNSGVRQFIIDSWENSEAEAMVAEWIENYLSKTDFWQQFGST